MRRDALCPFIAISLMLSVLLVTACGDDDPSGPTGWNNGHWSGETSMGQTVTFTLDHPTLEEWTLTVTHQYADTTDTRTWQSPSLSISQDSSFSWSDSVYSDTLQYSFSVTGSFATGDSAAGEWESIVYYQLGGSSGMDDLAGSWTATGP